MGMVTGRSCFTCEFNDRSGQAFPCSKCNEEHSMYSPNMIGTALECAAGRKKLRMSFPTLADEDECARKKQIGGNHYQMPIQPVEFIVKNDIPYREGNAIKYICRHRNKNGKQDIEKAIHYLEMILADYEEELS